MGSSGGEELTVALRVWRSVKIVASPPGSADATDVGCENSAAAGLSVFRIMATTAIAIATTERNVFSIRHRSVACFCFIWLSLADIDAARSRDLELSPPPALLWNVGLLTTAEAPGPGRLSSGVAYTR